MAAPQSSVHKLTLADLDGLDAGKYSGGQRRFYCPIHGGDHQRSLSIIDDGESAGIGTCHSCHARVVVTDWPGRAGWKPPQPLTIKQRAAQLLQPFQLRPTSPAREPTAHAAQEVAALRNLHTRMLARASDARAIAYLAGRGLDITADDTRLLDDAAIGYIPADARRSTAPGTLNMSKWCDRLIFPLWTPQGIGYAGRAIYGWQEGMDENAHKALLNAHADACQQSGRFNEHRRWEKTDPAGWYGPAASDLAPTLFIVEGPLDRVALLAAGMAANEVIALVGTASDSAIQLLPRQVTHVILALDGDAEGQEAAQKSARAMRLAGIQTAIAAPADDGMGKDASERFRRAGSDGLGYLFAAWDSLQGRRASVAMSLPTPPPVAAPAAPSAPVAAIFSTPAAHVNDGMFPEVERTTAPALDATLMRDLFSVCPWYDASAPDNAASQAALWICAGEAVPVISHMMAAYGLLLRLFSTGAPIAMSEGLRSYLNTASAPSRMGLAPFVALLRTAYMTRNQGMARACVDAALSDSAAPASTGSYSYRVQQLMHDGLGYFAACAAVTAANIAALA